MKFRGNTCEFSFAEEGTKRFRQGFVLYRIARQSAPTATVMAATVAENERGENL